MKTTTLKVITFFIVEVVARFLLQLIGHKHPGIPYWQTYQDTFTDPLNNIISTATAALTALLIPKDKVLDAGAAPPQPVQVNVTQINSSASNGQDEINALTAELSRWQEYGHKMEKYLSVMESSRSQLDTRQAVSRVSAYAILSLAFCLAVAGYLAPSYIVFPAALSIQSLSVNADKFFIHFEYQTIAVAIVSVAIGAIIYRIPPHTNLEPVMNLG